MKILLLNQAFHPDVVSSGQHLADLALALADRGHAVTVVTSRRAYDNPHVRFARRERWNGIKIIRVGSTGFGKGAKWKRAADFASFLACCSLRLATLPRQHAVVALTSPPLISFIGACVARVWRSRFFYWVMDLNPDEAIAAGWLRADSPAARVLNWMSRFSFRSAERIVALDHFMRERIMAKGLAPDRLAVIPPWSHDGEVRFDEERRERFRRAHGLEDKFVVMYSGNHSPCHPLDTLLAAAGRLAKERDIVFCFIGGGSEWTRIHRTTGPQDKGTIGPWSNIVCLPYQPLDQLAGSLSAADLHVVVMGERFVGIVHPCKIYNILAVGAPLLYLGPRPCHVTEILETMGGDRFGCAAHGQVQEVLNQIHRLRDLTRSRPRERAEGFCATFSKEALLPRLLAILEGGTTDHGTTGPPDQEQIEVGRSKIEVWAMPNSISCFQTSCHLARISDD
jgi:glycosyltransferase involved in cell wall biosynthesis